MTGLKASQSLLMLICTTECMTRHSLLFLISDISPLGSRDQHSFNQMMSAQYKKCHTQNHTISPRSFHLDRVGFECTYGKFVASFQSWCKLISGQLSSYLRTVLCLMSFLLGPLIYSMSAVACIIHGKLFYKRLLNTFCIQQKIKAAVWFMKHRAWCQNKLLYVIGKTDFFLFHLSILLLLKNTFTITDDDFEYRCHIL